MKNFLILFLQFLFIICNISCKNNPLSPDLKQPGRRDYVWTVDTISNIAPNNHYIALFGTAPNNIYIGGCFGDVDKYLLKYDGNKISVFNSFPYIGIWSITGSVVESNIWFGCGNGFILEYKNKDFNKYGPYTLPGCKNANIEFVYTDNETTLACGCIDVKVQVKNDFS